MHSFASACTLRVSFAGLTGLAAVVAGVPWFLHAVQASAEGGGTSSAWILPVVVTSIGVVVTCRFAATDRADGAFSGAVTALWGWWLGFAPAGLWMGPQAVWQRLAAGYEGADAGRQALADGIAEMVVVFVGSFLLFGLGGAALGALAAPVRRAPRPVALWWASQFVVAAGLLAVAVHAGAALLSPNLPDSTLVPLVLLAQASVLFGATASLVNGQRLRRLGLPKSGATHHVFALMGMLAASASAVYSGYAALAWVPWFAIPLAAGLVRVVRSPQRLPSRGEVVGELVWSRLAMMPLVAGPGGLMLGLGISYALVPAIDPLIHGTAEFAAILQAQEFAQALATWSLACIPLEGLIVIPVAWHWLRKYAER